MITELRERAELLRGLHRPGHPLVLPNAWDAASAAAVVAAGFPVVASASFAVSAVLGYPDGQGTPPAEMFAALRRIVRGAGTAPVTGDVEAGYGLEAKDLVGELLAAGVVGCNLEDTDHGGSGLVDADRQVEYLASVRAAATAAGVPLVINSRVDAFIGAAAAAHPSLVDEVVSRANRYLAAGADCVYPLGAQGGPVLAALVERIDGPVNLGVPLDGVDLAALASLGVARVSFGPQLHLATLTTLNSHLATLH